MIGSILLWLADRLASERFEITRSADNTPYLTRWTLFGRRFQGSGYAIFLHRFQRSDADEMHDHPWPFVSIVLAGGYNEKTPAPGWKNGDGPTRQRWYGPGRILVRPAEWVHSVLIPAGRESWTLILRGRKKKSWGFFCPRIGYRPWREHLATAARTGDGCA